MKKSSPILVFLRKHTVHLWFAPSGLSLIGFFCIGTGIASQSFAETSAQKSIRDAVQKKLSQSKLKSEDFGIVVGSPSEPQPDFELNGSKMMTPASATKIVVAGAALGRFPHGHQFKTEIYINSPIKEGKLMGPIYLKGGGDPSFISERMWYLVNEFKRTGISEVQGPIVVDDSIFDEVKFDSGRSDVRVDRAYDAPVGALSFNWNAVNVFVRPGVTGGPSKAFVDPENSFVSLLNKSQTGGSKLNLDVDRKTVGKKNEIVVTGKIPLNHPEKVIFKNITEPAIWAGSNLAEFLKQRGIAVGGGVESGKTPNGATLVATSPGATIQELVSMMMKFSNNFVAEMLVKNMSVEAGKTPGTLGHGIQEIKKELQRIGVDSNDFVISSVSGLSQDNKFKSRSLWKLQNILYNDFELGPDFVSSLPVSGRDGTLKSRLKGKNLIGRVKAKTGLLTGVVALSGFYSSKTGAVKSFVIVYNGRSEPWAVQSFTDDLLESLVQL